MREKNNLSVYIIMVLALLSACASQQMSSSGATDLYSEDLSYLRPKFETPSSDTITTDSNPVVTAGIAPTHTVNTKVNTVLDSLDKLNQLRRFIDGYTIQIYSGQNREEAITAKSKMAIEIGEEASLQYTQPKFRVTTGRYYSQLEAQKDLMRFRLYFPNAILVPEKILIK